MQMAQSAGDKQQASSFWLLWDAATVRFRWSPLGVGTILVGMMIALADGVTRQANTDWQFYASEALNWQPYWGMYALAAASLVLLWLYAGEQRISKAELLLLWLIFCTTAYTKDFAYLHIPGTPLYVTEIVLAISVISYLIWPRLRLVRLSTPIVGLIMWFVFVGAFDALRSVLAGEEILLVLRDFALVLYPLFAVVGMLLYAEHESRTRACIAFGGGVVISVVCGIGWFLVAPEQRRFIFFGAYLPSAFWGVLLLTLARIVPRKAGFAFVTLCAFGVVLCNARTFYVAMAFTLLVVLFTSRFASRRLAFSPWRVVMSCALLAGLFIGLLSLTDVGSAFLKRTGADLVSGTVGFENDPNAKFRFLAWLEAGKRFVQNPLIGEGYGVPFTFSLENYDTRPHNTFVTVLYKMGVVGAAPLFAILAVFFAKGWRVVRRRPDAPDAVLLYCILISQLSLCLYGMLNLLLESPFLASVFWLQLGMGSALMHQLARPTERNADL